MSTGKPVTSATPRGPSLRALRNLGVVSLAIATLVFSGGTYYLVQKIFAAFVPAVGADLEWKTRRGAHELALAADLGLAISDREMVVAEFGDYRKSKDVAAIVAIDAEGKVVGSHGTSPFPQAELFSGPARQIVRRPGYLMAWAPAEIEGAPIGKVAVVVTTQRLASAADDLGTISTTALAAGGVALLLGTLLIVFVTAALAKRDQRLRYYAANLQEMVERRTAQLDERNRGMRLVLDNVEQGFLTVNLDGSMESERSAIVDRWLGPVREGESIVDWIDRSDPAASPWLELGLQALVEGSMPLDITLGQMPDRLHVGERTMRVAYTPISNGTRLERLLVVITDITAELEREAAGRVQREMFSLFQRVAADRSGFDEFFAEAGRIVERIVGASGDGESELRDLHTLKGNCGLFELDSIAEVCHRLEQTLVDEGRRLTVKEREELGAVWLAAAERMGRLLGSDRGGAAGIGREELDRLVERARQGAPAAALLATLESWRKDPVSRRLNSLAADAQALGKRLGKSLTVECRDHGVRLDAGTWAPFWGAMVHAVRNAVDHGLEPESERVAAGKPAQATLGLESSVEDGSLCIRVRDDGRGIDWTAVEHKARTLGLAHATPADLQAALFAGGLSTKGEVSTISGRGVGVSVLWHEAKRLGGTIEIETARGRGTTMTFRFAAGEAGCDPGIARGARPALPSRLPGAQNSDVAPSTP